MPVQEFPIEKKTEEDDDFSMEPDTSLYKEDGSLEVCFTIYIMSYISYEQEHRSGSCSCLLAKHHNSNIRKNLLLQIEFSALLDVRSVKTSSSDSAEVAKSAPPEPDQSATKLKLSANKDLQTPIKGKFSNNLGSTLY